MKSATLQHPSAVLSSVTRLQVFTAVAQYLISIMSKEINDDVSKCSIAVYPACNKMASSASQQKTSLTSVCVS